MTADLRVVARRLRLAVLVGTGGFAGAVARHAVAVALPGGFPVGTLAANVLGSFALGALVAAPVESETLLVLGTGFCGAFTTFSTFAVETVRSYEDGGGRVAVRNVALNLAGALLAVGLGGLAAGVLL